MGVGRFAIVGAGLVVANVILYDPTDEFDPGIGRHLVELADDSPVQPGDTIDDKGAVTKPADVVAAPVDKYDALVAKLVDAKVLTAADADQLATAATLDAAPEAKP